MFKTYVLAVLERGVEVTETACLHREVVFDVAQLQ